MTTRDLVFRLLEQSLTVDHTVQMDSAADWAAVYELMKVHTVESLPYEWLKANPTA